MNINTHEIHQFVNLPIVKMALLILPLLRKIHIRFIRLKVYQHVIIGAKLLSAFEKWHQRNWKDYSFTRWTKDFGQRLVGKSEGQGFLSSDHIVLIYNFDQRKPTVEDFAAFLKDFEKFYQQYNDDYEIDGAYFTVYSDYDKKAFNLLQKQMDDDLKELVQVKLFNGKPTASPPNSSATPIEINNPPLKESNKKTKPQVFIVHGRDETPSLALARFIEKRYPLDVILLEEEAHRGRTIIEKLESYSDVKFAFITLTPDDIGALKGEKLKDRGRQNVIFELGQFIGKIGRKNVCLLIKGDVEIPSDLRGIGYYRFVNNIKECFIEVDTELKEANLTS